MNGLVDNPVDALRPRLQDIIDRFLRDQRTLLAGIHSELGALIDAAADLLRGGKRLRPAFCYWGWRGAGRPDDDAVVAVGAALELFQAAALVHDDLIDGSDTRRGMPSMHRRFATRHTAQRWAGEPDEFGGTAALLLGDLLLGWSDELFNGSGLDDAALRRARPVFDQMRTQVGVGQYLDVVAQATGADRPERLAELARTVVSYKAARYSVERPLVLGGSAAGAGPDVLAGYSRYGLALGEAFQLRDDVLGVFGDPASTGKPAGDDLREGKRTLLIAYTLERARPAAADTVNRLLGDRALDVEGVDTLRQIIVDTGALRAIESQVASLVEQSRRALREGRFTAEARSALDALITAATSRVA
ncbi:MAG TPA: polyprenyl synthetase family protein [Jiangellaceae bacterium]|nr:polyprenyl synthetase family protein [Jiangellaceae bacterium]